MSYRRARRTSTALSERDCCDDRQILRGDINVLAALPCGDTAYSDKIFNEPTVRMTSVNDLVNYPTLLAHDVAVRFVEGVVRSDASDC